MERIIPQTFRKNYERAMGGRSLKSAVKAFCAECVQYDRDEITKCTDTLCPLYPYRPFQATPWKARISTVGFKKGHAVKSSVQASMF